MMKIEMQYTNYRGVCSKRTIIPYKIEFRSTSYHPEPQWILTAYDFSRDDMRDFALADCQFLSHETPSS